MYPLDNEGGQDTRTRMRESWGKGALASPN
ncbi:hypothetical protein Q604_UNBC06889G0001, partial [human gut metagenome]